MVTAPSAQHFQKKLLAWYASHGRPLPWRNTRDPYRIWVSEMMLQQTQVDRVLLYYQNFLKRFPTVATLSRATWPQVLKAWRGLGYYRRARNMMRTAKIIANERKGKFPLTLDELQALPGIGPYTARAIAVFAYEQDVLVLDTNTSRVLSRFYGYRGKNLLKTIAEEAQVLVPKGKAWEFHQGLMDFGAMICTAKDPKCVSCPMKSPCKWFAAEFATETRRSGRFGLGLRPSANLSLTRRVVETIGAARSGYPRSRVSPTNSAKIDVAAGIIHKNGHILITQRKKEEHLAGFWEFPGGKRQPKESWRECLKREIKEELGIEVAVRPHDWTANYDYGDRRVHIRFHRCSILNGRNKKIRGKKFRWILPSELSRYHFPPANKEVVASLARAKFVDPHANNK